ncbi:MAG: YajQ family cyclic di-GMP-binding protein [Elusimicrobiales bacterium]|nr:YajQ family cyclic di-GMP-binding protein [Elusimicrobiales bacterium]
MADDFSFDVVSKVDMNALADSVNIAMKEIVNRYDFKGTNSTIELDQKTPLLKLASSDEFRAKALYDVLLSRMAKRGIPLRNFEPQKIESSLAGSVKQEIKIQAGIPVEKAKEMVKAVKDAKIKANAAIQGDQLRVTSRSKDELQRVMALLRGGDYGIELQFTNYR